MTRNSEIMVVDPDPAARSLALLALRRDGLRAVGAATRSEALETFQSARPMMVISELELDEGDGLSLMTELRAAGGHEVPVVLLSHPGVTLGADVRALGAEDLLPKPVFARDLVTLSQLHRGRPAGARVIEGRLEKTSAPYLLRALATGSRSGRVVFLEGEGEVSFRNGRILDASFRHRCGESALYRILTLADGPFHLFFEGISGSGALNLSVGDLLRQGLPFVQRWEALSARLPKLDTLLEIDFRKLSTNLAGLPDAVNGIVRLFDGSRDIERVLNDSPLPELTTLEVIDRLLENGSLRLPESAQAATVDQSASEALMRSLFGEGLPPGIAGAEALSAQAPASWTQGDPIDWDTLEPLPGQPTAVEEDPSAITGWDLPAALEQASKVAHAAALEQDLPGGVLRPEAELSYLAEAADLGEALAPDFELDAFGEGDAVDADADVAADELSAFETFDAVEMAFLAGEEGTPREPLGWPTWIGVFAIASTVVLAAAFLLFGSPAETAEGPARIVRAVSPTPAPVAVALPTEARPPAAAAVVVPKDDAWLADQLQAASKAYSEGNYGDAVLGYAGAAIERRDSLQARLGLGLAYLELGDLEGATGAFRAARELDPSSGRALALLGSTLQIAGQRVEARKAYRQYLELHPQGPQATEIRAVLQGWGD